MAQLDLKFAGNFFIQDFAQWHTRDHIYHARGLRQGDPLSPMLFILAMEPLQQIMKEAEEANIFSNLFQRQRRFRCSLYVADVALFAKPSEDELSALQKIICFFAQVSGLRINMSKTEICQICCAETDLDDILPFFPRNKKIFPLQIFRNSTPYQKIEESRLAAASGQGRIKNSRLERESLHFSRLRNSCQIISVGNPNLPPHFLQKSKCLYKRIDRYRRAFLWTGEDPDNVSVGSCLVN